MTVVPLELAIPIGDIKLVGVLALPPAPVGFVMFAHGSGSGRLSPRNRHVATRLQERGLATLLLDLHTVEEEHFDATDTTLRCDVDMLAERLISATDSVIDLGRTLGLPIGYFGGSTGAPAALMAAARRPREISAVVCRGGCPDLAGAALSTVRAPTLLIVGGQDDGMVEVNRAAAQRIAAPHRIAVVPGAGHLFEEPGALDEVARLAGDWFLSHLGHDVLQKAS